MNPAPIVLFVYNRPWHTARTLKTLSLNTRASDSMLYVFADGCKSGSTPEQLARQVEVLSVVNSFRKCFKELILEVGPGNKGLASSVIYGVSKVIEQWGRAIVMEDDLESSPHLLSYFNDALDHFEHEDRVMHVGAYMYPICTEGLPETFFFRLATSWGWATWKRAWKQFEPDVERLLKQFDRNKIHDFRIDGSENFWKQLNHFRKGKNDSWAIRWYASVFLKGGLALHPSHSLVRNIGSDGTGVHSEQTSSYDVVPYERRITHFPVEIEENLLAIKRISHFFRHRKGNLWVRAVRFLKKKMVR